MDCSELVWLLSWGSSKASLMFPCKQATSRSELQQVLTSPLWFPPRRRPTPTGPPALRKGPIVWCKSISWPWNNHAVGFSPLSKSCLKPCHLAISFYGLQVCTFESNKTLGALLDKARRVSVWNRKCSVFFKKKKRESFKKKYVARPEWKNGI